MKNVTVLSILKDWSEDELKCHHKFMKVFVTHNDGIEVIENYVIETDCVTDVGYRLDWTYSK